MGGGRWGEGGLKGFIQTDSKDSKDSNGFKRIQKKPKTGNINAIIILFKKLFFLNVEC